MAKSTVTLSRKLAGYNNKLNPKSKLAYFHKPELKASIQFLLLG